MDSIDMDKMGQSVAEEQAQPQPEQVDDQNLVYLPEGVLEDAKAGDPVEVSISGSIVEKDGMMYVKAEMMDGQEVKAPAKEGNKDRIKTLESLMAGKTDELKSAQNKVATGGQDDEGY